MTLKPEFGFFMAGLSLVVLALGWAMVLVPLSFYPLRLASDDRGAYIQYVRVAAGPAATGGIVAGDRLDTASETFVMRWRLNAGAPAGTPLTLRIGHQGVWTNRVVRAAPRPIFWNSPKFATGALVLTVGVLLAALIVARRPSLGTAAFVVYTWGTIPSFIFEALFSALPDPAFAVLACVLDAVLAVFPLVVLYSFISRFPREPSAPRGLRRMHLADAAVAAGFAICLAVAIAEPVSHRSWAAFVNAFQVAAILVGAVFAALQYRDATGDDRRRMGWVITGYGITMVSYVVGDFFLTNVSDDQLATAISDIGTLALPVALGYAILRHRVLDIGFALNRTVVYAVVTAVVVVLVSLADWLAGRLIGETRLALAAEAAVTIALGVALNTLHARIEELVERILFRGRHIAERRLLNGVEALAFAVSDAAVDRALTDEVAHAIGLRSTAFFRDAAGTGHFRCVRATGWPEDVLPIADDALLVRTLRVRERPVHLADFGISEPTLPHGAAAPVLAVPVADRHALLGFVLYGALADGTAPDPEVVDLLGRLGLAAAAASAYVEARDARRRLAHIEQLVAQGAVSPA